MPDYTRTSTLQKRQNKLFLDLVDYDLNKQWHSHDLINSLRKKIIQRMPSGLFDPQDLEHQVLFRLTTFAPEEITDEVIETVIVEQLAIIQDRLKSANADLEYLFRGLLRKHRDLNVSNRLELKNIAGELVAIGNGCSFEVEFKKISDPHIIDLFTEKLHYIHSGRQRGDVFGLFFKGDELPWGVETTEPSIITKEYKKDSLLAHGIDPHKAIEITRLYLLPGSPKNAISILDGLVGRYYKDQDLEAMYTTTMPTYAKTKGATTAGGMKDVLLVKELTHSFVPRTINGKICYALQVSSEKSGQKVVKTHPAFPTLYTVETFMRLNANREIQALPILEDRAIYVSDKHRMGRSIVKETKFRIDDVEGCLRQLRDQTTFKSSSFIRDEFWKDGDKPRVRLRTINQFDRELIEVSRKYRLSQMQHIRTEVAENLYSGTSMTEAREVIKKQGDYSLKNSFEKMNVAYQTDQCSVDLNVYPFGAFLEVSGAEQDIWAFAKNFGLSRSDSIAKNTDESYLDWNKGTGLPELLHIRFGLSKS